MENVVSAVNGKSSISFVFLCIFNDSCFPPATPPFPLETLSFCLLWILKIERPGNKGRGAKAERAMGRGCGADGRHLMVPELSSGGPESRFEFDLRVSDFRFQAFVLGIQVLGFRL